MRRYTVSYCCNLLLLDATQEFQEVLNTTTLCYVFDSPVVSPVTTVKMATTVKEYHLLNKAFCVAAVNRHVPLLWLYVGQLLRVAHLFVALLGFTCDRKVHSGIHVTPLLVKALSLL